MPRADKKSVEHKKRNTKSGEQKMRNVKLVSVTETTFGDETCWVEYKVDGLTGYEIMHAYTDCKDMDLQLMEDLLNTETIYDALSNKLTKRAFSLDEIDSYLYEIINACRQSDNEMIFIEKDDERLNDLIALNPSFLDVLEVAVDTSSLNDYIKFNEDDCLITVYGGVISKVLFE